jgi:hypothetical protein
MKAVTLPAVGIFGATPWTLVDAIQDFTNDAFYVLKGASTPKPVRFVVIDDGLDSVNPPPLTLDLCHDFPDGVSCWI